MNLERRVIVAFEPFFHAFLKKAAINRISRILPSRKGEREILFPFRRDQEIGSSHNIRRMQITHFLVFDPLSHYERPQGQRTRRCLGCATGSSGEVGIGEHSSWGGLTT
ncbi:hypothetical protein KSP39_PZI012662 [Platanthera zijinensis]|uniref:Uncharacterized protein n=1 Tax=Platanthera zijinensis TaxID=2320716 RepID=A0AAP0G4V9_9ASPA